MKRQGLAWQGCALLCKTGLRDHDRTVGRTQRCAAARLGRMQSLPVRPDSHTCDGNNHLKSNPCRYDKAPRCEPW